MVLTEGLDDAAAVCDARGGARALRAAPEAAATTRDDRRATTDRPRAASRGPRILAALALVLLAVAARALGGRAPELVARIDDLGVWGPVVFVLAYAIGVVLLVPGSALTLAAGALFGIGRGLVFAWCAATLGAGLAFLVARYLARDAVARRLASHARVAALDRALAHGGLTLVFLLRLSPVFPFSLLNYALGLTRIGFMDYLLASVGMLPGTLLYVYTGSVLGLAAQAAAGTPPVAGTFGIAVLTLGLVATLAVTVLAARLARRALSEVTGE